MKNFLRLSHLYYKYFYDVKIFYDISCFLNSIDLRTILILFLGNNADAQKFLSRPAQVIIRMRGLPYDSTSKQVVRAKIFYIFRESFFFSSF